MRNNLRRVGSIFFWNVESVKGASNVDLSYKYYYLGEYIKEMWMHRYDFKHYTLFYNKIIVRKLGRLTRLYICYYKGVTFYLTNSFFKGQSAKPRHLFRYRKKLIGAYRNFFKNMEAYAAKSKKKINGSPERVDKLCGLLNFISVVSNERYKLLLQNKRYSFRFSGFNTVMFYKKNFSYLQKKLYERFKIKISLRFLLFVLGGFSFRKFVYIGGSVLRILHKFKRISRVMLKMLKQWWGSIRKAEESKAVEGYSTLVKDVEAFDVINFASQRISDVKEKVDVEPARMNMESKFSIFLKKKMWSVSCSKKDKKASMLRLFWSAYFLYQHYAKFLICSLRKYFCSKSHCIFLYVISMWFTNKVELAYVELAKTDVTPELLSRYVCSRLKQGVYYKRLGMVVRNGLRVIQNRVTGCRLHICGRPVKAPRAKKFKYFYGAISKNTLNAHILYTRANVTLKYGVVGVKIWLNLRQKDEVNRLGMLLGKVQPVSFRKIWHFKKKQICRKFFRGF